MEKRKREIDRRRQSIKSVLYGGIKKRRRTNRRASDDQRFILDWYDSGLFMVAMGIVLMSCIDALFTLNLLRMGAEELNYFMKVLIEADVSTFLIVKLMLTCGGVLFLVAFQRFRLGGVLQVRRVLEAMCAVYSCLIVWELYLLLAVARDLA